MYIVSIYRICCSIVRIQFEDPERQPDGGVAQLGEHLPCKQGVKGSIPFISTIKVNTLKMDELKKPEKKTGL